MAMRGDGPFGSGSEKEKFEALIKRLNEGDSTTVDILIELVYSRLEHLARRMLRRNPAVRRWSDTGDLTQESAVRLAKALKEVEIRNAEHFFSLAALQIRRALIDMWRKFYGPSGMGRFHESVNLRPAEVCEKAHIVEVHRAPSPGPSTWAVLREYYSLIESLPDRLKKVFDYHYYCGLTHEQTARLIGVSPDHAKRLWREARLALVRKLKKSS